MFDEALFYFKDSQLNRVIWQKRLISNLDGFSGAWLIQRPQRADDPLIYYFLSH